MKKKVSLQFCIIFFVKIVTILLAITSTVAAATALQLPPLDMSMNILGAVFGTVNPSVGPGMGPVLMGQVYGQFNSIVMTVAMLYMTYSTVMITFDATAKMQKINEGSLVNICLRTAIGLALLVPNTNGYNMAQVLMMWIVNQSVALADNLWSTVINYYQNGQPFYLQTQAAWGNDPNSFYQQAGSSFSTFLGKVAPNVGCIQVRNWQNMVSPSSTPSNYQMVYNAAKADGLKGCINFGLPGADSLTDCTKVPTCGQVAFSTNPIDSGSPTLANQLPFESTIYDIVSAMNIYAGQLLAIDGYFISDVNPLPFSSADNANCHWDQTNLAFATGATNCTSMSNYATTSPTSSPTTFHYSAQNYSRIPADSMNYYYDYYLITQLNQVSNSSASLAAQDTTSNAVVDNFLNCFNMNLKRESGKFVACASQLGWLYAGLAYIPFVGYTGANGGMPGSNVGNYKTSIDNMTATAAVGCDATGGSNSKPGCVNTPIGTSAQAADDFVANVGVWATQQFSAYQQKSGGSYFRQKCTSTRGVKGMAGKILNKFGGIKLCKPELMVTSLAVMLGGVIGTEIPQALSTIDSRTLNPSLGLSKLGMTFLNVANGLLLTIIFSGVGAAILTFISWTTMVGWNAVTFLVIIIGIMIAMMMLLYEWGFMLAYYVPLVPVLIFISAGLGWIFIVVEAMTAAPLAAAALLHPEGDGFLGKAEPAVMLSINIFLRPSLLIIGWTAAILMVPVCFGYMHDMLYAVLRFLNYEFALKGAGSTSMNNAGFVFVNILSTIALISTFMGVIIPLIPQIYMITTYLPDKILRWMGDNSGGFAEAFATQGLLSATEQKAHETGGQGKASVESTFKGAGQSAGKFAAGKAKEQKEDERAEAALNGGKSKGGTGTKKT